MSDTEAQDIERCRDSIIRDGNIELTIGQHRHGLARDDIQRVATTLSARKDVITASVGADNYLHVVPNYGHLRKGGDAREAFVLQMKETIAQAIVHKRSHPGGGARARSTSDAHVTA